MKRLASRLTWWRNAPQEHFAVNAVEILNHALDDGHLPPNPATRLSRFYLRHTEAEARPEVSTLTEAELTTLLTECQGWYADYLELIATAAWTGLRQGEVLGLQWEDVDFLNRFVEVQRTVGYRGGRLLVGSPRAASRAAWTSQTR